METTDDSQEPDIGEDPQRVLLAFGAAAERDNLPAPKRHIEQYTPDSRHNIGHHLRENLIPAGLVEEVGAKRESNLTNKTKEYDLTDAGSEMLDNLSMPSLGETESIHARIENLEQQQKELERQLEEQKTEIERIVTKINEEIIPKFAELAERMSKT